MIKTLNKVGIERNFFPLIKRICKHQSTRIVLNGERLECFLIDTRDKTRMSTLTTCIQHVLEALPGKGREIGVAAIVCMVSF